MLHAPQSRQWPWLQWIADKGRDSGRTRVAPFGFKRILSTFPIRSSGRRPLVPSSPDSECSDRCTRTGVAWRWAACWRSEAFRSRPMPPLFTRPNTSPAPVPPSFVPISPPAVAVNFLMGCILCEQGLDCLSSVRSWGDPPSSPGFPGSIIQVWPQGLVILYSFFRGWAGG
jgi:hypothetical protein